MGGAALTREALQFGCVIMSFVAIGMAGVLFFSQERNRTNVLWSSGTFAVGMAIGTTPFFLNDVDPTNPELLARLQGVFEVGVAVIFGALMLALLDSSTLTGTRSQAVRACSWAAIGLGGWHAIASFTWPAQRLNDYAWSLTDPGVLSRPGFWLFAAYFMVALVTFAVGWGLLAFGGGLDPTEARRAQALVVGSAFLIALTAVPPTLTPVLFVPWICIVFFGQLQYTSARAQRGVFLSRFLSPRVTELVAARGLAETMTPHHADLTVVSADLRGFTAYSEGVPSQSVVDLLTDYYDAVGEVASRHGATITSYAGDGVLILVGAPLPDPNHAATGIQLARELLSAVEPVLDHWRTLRHNLGLGIGVASGTVTVGVISADTHMEYTAIGVPVNLAARLCSTASANEILIDAEAARLSNVEGLRSKGETVIKGFSDMQHVYAIGHATD